METTADTLYGEVARIIRFVREHFRSVPDVEVLAGQMHVSPGHLEELFLDWAGISPKAFLKTLGSGHAKELLAHKEEGTLFDALAEAAPPCTGPAHDRLMDIEGMTPEECAGGGKNLLVRHSFAESPFGPLIIASTEKGVCHLAFSDDRDQAFEDLKKDFPQADHRPGLDVFQENALAVFRAHRSPPSRIRLHLKGTAFQLKVWHSLLKIPIGSLTTYAHVAADIGMPRAPRAVGTAIGDNPVGFLVPCHRVVRSSGELGGYMWGPTRKAAIIGWEAGWLEI